MVNKQSALATLTLKNGLIVQYLGSGHVLQMHTEEGDGIEANRLVTKEGIVIRQFKNRDAELLFPDGVRATFSKKMLEWIIVNNKGMRRSYKDGIYTDLEPIPCAMETDSVTHATMMIREDNVVTVRYKDGSLFCQHEDGTRMHTSVTGKEIRIEKLNHASHIVKLNGGDVDDRELDDEDLQVVKAKPVKGDAFDRALDKRVVETYLPDGCKSQTFLDNVCTHKRGIEKRYRHMIKRADLSTVVVDSKGHISIITSNARAALNECGKKHRISQEEKDTDYLAELARKAGEFVPQVYQAHISNKEGKSKITAKNTRNDT